MNKQKVMNNKNNGNDDLQPNCDGDDDDVRPDFCPDETEITYNLTRPNSNDLKKMYPEKNTAAFTDRPSSMTMDFKKNGDYQSIHSTNIIGKCVCNWTVEEVGHWLHANKFSHLVDLFCNQHRIDGSVLISLNDNDLRYEPLKLQVLGDIKRLVSALDQLRGYEKTLKNCNLVTQKRTKKRIHAMRNETFVSDDNDDEYQDYPLNETIERVRSNDDNGGGNRQAYVPLPKAEHSHSESCSSSISSSVSDPESITEEQSDSTPKRKTNFARNKLKNKNSRIQARIVSTIITAPKLASLVRASHPNYSSRESIGAQAPANSSFLAPAPVEGPSSSSSSSHKISGKHNGNACSGGNHSSQYSLSKKYHKHHHRNNEFKPEAWKAFVALCYFFASTWVTAIVMVIVHDRVPDMDTYPPLPDLILDNLPLIPWAFSMAETCGLILFIIWTLILIFHKHRFILLRRMFSLFGSVFLLRCFTMVITSLSVPGRHLQCKARPYGTWMERLHQALLIWQGGGMAIKGVRTCGDYMFSGHTVVLTMLNFFITEYTPRWLSLIHTASWVLNLFGVFFILAAHEHYSIDVFIAFYISTRLFLYYHTLANNRALYQPDRHRTRIWFPLFSFFESGVSGIVPNEYEIPFRSVKDRLWQWMSRKIRQSSLVRIMYEWDLCGTGSGVEDNSETSVLIPNHSTVVVENTKHVKSH